MSIGPLQFGDAGALINADFFTRPAAADMSCNNDWSDTTGVTYDANGVLVGSNAAARIRYNDIVNFDNIETTGFQVSIEVARAWSCMDSASEGSLDGYTPSSTEYIIEITGTTPIQMGRFSGTSGMRMSIGSNTCRSNPFNLIGGSYSDTDPRLSSFGRDSYIRHTLSGTPNGANMDLMYIVDGVLLAEGSIAIGDVGGFNGGNIWLGSRSSADRQDNYYMKNFQFALEPVEYDQTKTILLFGDSMVRNHSISSGPYYNSNQLPVMLKTLHDAGDWVDSRNCYLGKHDGFMYQSPPAAASSSLADEIDGALLASNPTDVVMIGGTNDVGNGDNDIFFEAGVDYVNNAVKSYDGVERWATVNVRSFVGNTSQDTPANQDRRDDIVNPYLSGIQPPLVDAYTLQGLEIPIDDYTYVGQLITPGLDLHIAAGGAVREGEAYVNALAAIATGSPSLTTPEPVTKLITQGVTI